MQGVIVQSNAGVTLVGGGELSPGILACALSHAPRLVAADSGADQALAEGHTPEMVIGDLDSLSKDAQQRLGAERLHRITEQETTDFDKALRCIDAPFVLAVGFLGARLDHTLGAFSVLLRHPTKRCLLMNGEDLCFLAPTELNLLLEPGTRLSLFPMGDVTGQSEGLRWPIDGIEFAPGGMTGLSNVVTEPRTRLSFAAPRMLVLVPVGALERVIAALDRASG